MTNGDIWWYFMTFGLKSCRSSWYVMTFHDMSWYDPFWFREVPSQKWGHSSGCSLDNPNFPSTLVPFSLIWNHMDVDFLNCQMPFWSFHSFTALMHKYFQWWMREDHLLDGTFFHQEIWWINTSFTNPLLKDLPSPAVPSHLLSWHSRICTSRGPCAPSFLVWTLVNNDTKMIISFQICLEGNGLGFQRIYSSTLPHRLHSPVTGNGHTLSRQMQWNWNAMDLKCDSECFY